MNHPACAVIVTSYPSVRLVVAVSGNHVKLPRDEVPQGISAMLPPASFDPPATTGELSVRRLIAASCADRKRTCLVICPTDLSFVV
jgi:hypothetical protein